MAAKEKTRIVFTFRGSTAAKRGRHQMAEIMSEIQDTPKNGIHRSYVLNP